MLPVLATAIYSKAPKYRNALKLAFCSFLFSIEHVLLLFFIAVIVVVAIVDVVAVVAVFRCSFKNTLPINRCSFKNTLSINKMPHEVSTTVVSTSNNPRLE